MTNFGATGETIYKRTYSRTKPDGTKEQWPDTVDRVIAGNLALVDSQFIRQEEEARLRELMLDFKIIPAGRHLWATKDPATGEKSEHLFNCHRSIWGPKLSSHFCFVFNSLLVGGGVGENYSTSYLRTLPPPRAVVEPSVVISPDHQDRDEVAGVGAPLPPASVEIFKVKDSRTGWVEALRFLIDTSEEGGGRICFDVSDVREKGAPIKSFGGVASGPAPLVKLLIEVAEVLNGAVGRPLNPIEAMTIDHYIAVAVVSGNVRRSARMSILHWRDPFVWEFLNCKNNDSFSHFTTNISLEVDDVFWMALGSGNPDAEKIWEHLIEAALNSGEPGIYNTGSVNADEAGDLRACNPCGEVPLPPAGLCNLGHVNLAAYGDDVDGICEAMELMSRFLLRASHAEIEDPTQREVNDRDRRIGCGIFGVQPWALSHGIRWSEIHKSKELAAKLEVFKDFARRAADSYAEQLQIAKPIKVTTIAPTGTIAKLPGTTEGCHPIYARYFLRRIRFAADSPELQTHIDAGHLIEDCIYTPNTKVVTIPCRDSLLDDFPADMIEQSDEIPLETMLATQAFFQKHYADQGVSFTANINPGIKPEEVDRALRLYGPHLKGTTIFPDLSRPMSPYERITEEEYTGSEVGQALDDCSNGQCVVR